MKYIEKNTIFNEVVHCINNNNYSVLAVTTSTDKQIKLSTDIGHEIVSFMMKHEIDKANVDIGDDIDGVEYEFLNGSTIKVARLYELTSFDKYDSIIVDKSISLDMLSNKMDLLRLGRKGMKRFIIKTVILFAFGFMSYMLVELIFRQHTYFMSGIMGGISVVIIDKFNDWFSFDEDFFFQCVLGGFTITFLELIVGSMMYLCSWMPIMWDYSNVPLNYYGIICVPFTLLWIILSALIFCADAINYYFLHEEPAPYYKVLGKTILQFPQRINK